MGRGRGRDEGKGWRDSDGAIESLVLPGCEQEEGTLGQQRVNAPENASSTVREIKAWLGAPTCFESLRQKVWDFLSDRTSGLFLQHH